MRLSILSASLLILGFSIDSDRSIAAGPQDAVVRPDVGLPPESAGWDAVLRGLLKAFETADVVMLGEAHTRKVDSDLRLRLIRHPDFAATVRFIAVEFGSAAHQSVLDRYVAGGDVSSEELTHVRGRGVYAELVDTVRELNRTLVPSRQLRVLTCGQPGGNPGQRNDAAVAVLREHVLSRREKALVIFGAGHVWHREGGLTRRLQEIIPGRVFVAETLAPIANGRTGPEYAEQDRSLLALEGTIASRERPILVAVKQTNAAKLTANPFYLGQAMLPSDTTLGDLDDAIVYFGRGPDAGALAPAKTDVAIPVEAPRLMYVEYKGTKQLRITDIEKTLRRHEIPVLLDVPFHSRTICVVKEVLLDMLAEKGFIDAVVTPRSDPIRRSSDQPRVRVTFTIVDGRRSAHGRSAPPGLPPTARCSG